jgi:hypothetical protein
MLLGFDTDDELEAALELVVAGGLRLTPVQPVSAASTDKNSNATNVVARTDTLHSDVVKNP